MYISSKFLFDTTNIEMFEVLFWQPILCGINFKLFIYSFIYSSMGMTEEVNGCI